MTAYMFLPNTINEHYYSISVINFLTFTMSSSLQILISCVLPKSIRLNRSAIAMTSNYLQITREKLLWSIILKNESTLPMSCLLNKFFESIFFPFQRYFLKLPSVYPDKGYALNVKVCFPFTFGLKFSLEIYYGSRV